MQLEEIKLPEFSDKLDEEIQLIGRDYISGALSEEFAMLRICRLILEDKYRGTEIVDQRTGEVISFVSQEQLVRYVCDLFNISRQTVFSRLDGYKKLVNGLGRDYYQTFKLMLTAPGVPKRLNDAVQWDRDGRIASIDLSRVKALPSPNPEYQKIINDPEIKEEDKIPHVREALGTLMDDASELGRSEATRMVDGVLAKNALTFSHNGHGNLVGHCVEKCIDEKGVIYDAASYLIEWQPDCDVPEWVREKLYSRLHASEENNKVSIIKHRQG